MGVSKSDRTVVEGLFKAMQAGPAGEELMMSLFHENAVFIEPFSGQPLTHTGHAAIRTSFREQTAHPLPDMKLTLDRVDMDGAVVRAEWTCSSSAFPTPMRGHDLFTIREGRIDRLEIVVTGMPGMTQ
jgi:ketosteroid isomerase-like protein